MGEFISESPDLEHDSANRNVCGVFLNHILHTFIYLYTASISLSTVFMLIQVRSASGVRIKI